MTAEGVLRQRLAPITPPVQRVPLTPSSVCQSTDGQRSFLHQCGGGLD